MTAFERSVPAAGTTEQVAEGARLQLAQQFSIQGEPRMAQAVPIGQSTLDAAGQRVTQHTLEIQFSRRQLEFRSLIQATNQDPTLVAKNESRLDRILHSADRDTDVAMQRMHADLKRIGGNAAFKEKNDAENHLVRNLLQTDEYSKFSLQAEEYMTHREYGIAPKKAIAESLATQPGLIEACDRLVAAKKNPVLHQAQQIVDEATLKVKDSFDFRELYAKVLAGNGRSGKALALIVQRKEMQRQFTDFE
jgi:hypothetical protein